MTAVPPAGPDARLFEVSVPSTQTVVPVGGGNDYTTYTIRCKGPEQGTWQVSKRFSDFAPLVSVVQLSRCVRHR